MQGDSFHIPSISIDKMIMRHEPSLSWSPRQLGGLFYQSCLRSQIHSSLRPITIGYVKLILASNKQNQHKPNNITCFDLQITWCCLLRIIELSPFSRRCSRPTLQPATAVLTLADMDVELSMDRCSRDFHLILVNDVGFDDLIRPARALFGQRDHVIRGSAMDFCAVLFVGFTAGLFGIGLGFAFGKRRGLTFVGSAELFDFGSQTPVLRFQRDQPLFEGMATRA